MPATIFRGTTIVTLKDILRVGNGTDAPRIINSTVDPTSVATDADPGSLLLNRSTGAIYQKNDSGSTTNWTEIGASSANESSLLENLGLEVTVASSAMTVALKQADGSTDPAAGASAIRAALQGSTVADGDYDLVSLAAAESLVVPSTATLGMASGVTHTLYVYILNNAGTIEVAISGSLFDDGSIVTTTALGTGSDSSSTMFSTTARSNVSCRLVGRMDSNQATAGTWASAPTEVSIPPFIKRNPFAIAQSTSGQTLTTASLTIVDYSTIIEDSHNKVTTGASWTYECPENGIYSIMATIEFAESGNWTVGEILRLEAVVNGSLVGRMYLEEMQVTGTFITFMAGALKFNCSVGDLIDVRAFQGSGSNLSLNTTALRNRIYISKVGES